MMIANLMMALAAALAARADYNAEPHFTWLRAKAEEAEREVESALQDYVDARIAAYLAAQGKEQP